MSQFISKFLKYKYFHQILKLKASRKHTQKKNEHFKELSSMGKLNKSSPQNKVEGFKNYMDKLIGTRNNNVLW